MNACNDVSIPEVNMLKNTLTLALCVPINVSIKSGFVSVVDRGYGLQKWRVAANMLNKQQWPADRTGPPAWGLVEGLTNNPSP